MFWKNALSNHSCNSDYELWSLSGGFDIHYESGFTPDHLHYHRDVTELVEELSEDDKFIQVKTLKGVLLYLKIPKSIVKKELGKTYYHKEIFDLIVKRKVSWLIENNRDIKTIEGENVSQ